MPELQTVEQMKDLFDRVYDSTEYKDRRDKWRRFLKEYMGEWWDEAHIPIGESKVFVNLLFSTIETNAPLLTDNKPMWTVLSRWPHQQGIADNMTRASRAIWDKLEIDMLNLKAVKDSQLFGTGIYKIYFSPEKDDLQIEVIDPSTFVIAPGYEDEWEASWCGQKRRLPMDWVRRSYPDKAEEVEASQAKNEDDEGLWDREDVEGEEDFVTVYEIWMRDDSVEDVEEEVIDQESEEIRTEKSEVPSYPNGRIITFTEDNVLLDDRPSPFNHGKPPYVALKDYPVPHRFWGQGEADQIENLVREHNVRLQHIVDIARKYSKKNYVMSEDAGISAAKMKEAIRTGDNVLLAKADFHKDMITELPPPSLDGASLQLLSIIPEYIEEITGVTDITKGTTGKKSRQSASEISVLIESSYTRTRQRVRNLEFAIKRVLTLILELMQQYYVEPRPYQWREDEEVGYGYMSNDPQFVLEQQRPNVPDIPEEEMHRDDKQALSDYRRLVEDFMGEEEIAIRFELQIDTNSTLPLDKQSLANLAMRLAENKILPEEALLEILRFPNKDRYMRMLKERREEAREAKQGGPKPPQQQGAPSPQAVMRQQQGG